MSEQVPKDVLSPCPFCGVEVDPFECPFPLDRERKYWAVRCQDSERCEAEMIGASPEEVVARWNKRTSA